jgi:cytochrome c oxidase subunit II
MDKSFSLFPEQASTLAKDVDALLYFLLSVSVFFSILITALIVYFAVKYRRRPGNEKPTFTEPKLSTEILWIAGAFAITMVMFGWGAVVFLKASRPPADAHEIYVVGRQWMWKLQHPSGPREINDLHVPVGRPVKLIMTSEDVIHSLFIPAFRTKMDVLPGRYTTLWFEATKPGRYHLFCAEYCGSKHSRMTGSVYAMDPAQYADWLEKSGEGLRPLSAEGERLFRNFGCAECHQAGPTVGGPVLGPDLAGLFGRRVILQDGGDIVADETYLRESILYPQRRLVAGYRPTMPSFEGRASEEELAQLVSYIKSMAREDAP